MILSAMKYGGLLGKTKGMFANRIRMSDYADLKSKTSVYDIVSFLKNHPGYDKLLVNVSERSVDRISLESVLRKKAQMDFIKILKFTNEDDRKFLKYYVYQNEVDQILKYIRLIISKKTNEYDYVPFGIFRESSHVNFSAFKSTSTLSEFIDLLIKTPYYNLLAPFKDKKQINYTLIEVTLQTHFFSVLFDLIKKHVSAADKIHIKSFTQDTVDLLNFMRIMRCIAVGQERETIYANLIPFTHDLSQKTITSIINTESYDEAFNIIKTTKFRKIFNNFNAEEKKNIEHYYYQFISDYTRRTVNSSVLSLRIAYAYIWLKEIEIKNIINIIEAKSYGLSNDEIDKFLIGLKRER